MWSPHPRGQLFYDRATLATCGVGEVAPHDLRRTCARHCHQAGGELEQIQFLLGHVSIQISEHPSSFPLLNRRYIEWPPNCVCRRSSGALVLIRRRWIANVQSFVKCRCVAFEFPTAAARRQ
jgi:hypothetical protein